MFPFCGVVREEGGEETQIGEEGNKKGGNRERGETGSEEGTGERGEEKGEKGGRRKRARDGRDRTHWRGETYESLRFIVAT